MRSAAFPPLTRRLAVALAVGATFALAAGTALADSGKTIRILVGFPAGGGTDAIARTLADKLRQRDAERFALETSGGSFAGRALVLGNIDYIEQLDDPLVEIVELPDHPWFFACQFHPEFTSTPRDGHPLFKAYIEAALAYQASRCQAD